MNQQVVTREDAAPPAPISEATAIVQMIERAALNPAVDVDKMERLLLMQERVMGREAERAFNEAISLAQAELSPVATDAANPSTKSRYASYAALDRAVRPVYVRYGLALTFGTEDCPIADHVRVSCRLTHRDGHSRDYHIDMPADGKGAKGGDVMTKTHATGAAMSYGQRYLLKLIFNIAVGDDDDGNSGPRVREQGAAASAAIAALNACNTAVELSAWKKNNGEAVRKLPESGEIIALYNRRVEALRKPAQ